jgi:hypothetical protein
MRPGHEIYRTTETTSNLHTGSVNWVISNITENGSLGILVIVETSKYCLICLVFPFYCYKLSVPFFRKYKHCTELFCFSETRPLTDRYLDCLDRHVVLRIRGLDKSRPPYRDQVLLVDCLDHHLEIRFCSQTCLDHHLSDRFC